MIRQAAVAGSFYPAGSSQLQSQLKTLLVSEQTKQPAKALIVPHAGYVFSGALAGELIARSKIPPTVIMFGPNHQGAGAGIAVSAADSWQTPLGNVPIATEIREQLCSQIPEMVKDDLAHQHEHSLEVMLPLLQTQQAALTVVPVALRSLSLEACLQLGTAVAEVLTERSEEILLLASSDMNHFLDADTTVKLDSMAIEAMKAYDPQRLFQTVRENRISMCGVLPTVVVMQAARKLGAGECRLIRYAHSGQVNGDNSRVVGYAALTID